MNKLYKHLNSYENLYQLKMYPEGLSELIDGVKQYDDALEDADGNKLAPWVGINAYVIGEANGEWLANYAKENGKPMTLS